VKVKIIEVCNKSNHSVRDKLVEKIDLKKEYKDLYLLKKKST